MSLQLHDKEDREYWDRITTEAKKRGSDGCTAVPDWHIECCYQHDIEWGGKTIDGDPISRAECNERFRQCIQNRSKVEIPGLKIRGVTIWPEIKFKPGRFSPLSWWRWAGVWIGTGWERMTS